MACSAGTYEAPQTPAELQLAVIWAEILGIPLRRIGKRDHFFDLGGTSLSVLKLAVALGGVPFKQITAHPVLADQAALIDRRSQVTSS